MYKKYFLLGIIFILLAVNINSCLSKTTGENNLLYDIVDNENIDIYIGKIKEGHGLTVEITNSKKERF